MQDKTTRFQNLEMFTTKIECCRFPCCVFYICLLAKPIHRGNPRQWKEISGEWGQSSSMAIHMYKIQNTKYKKNKNIKYKIQNSKHKKCKMENTNNCFLVMLMLSTWHCFSTGPQLRCTIGVFCRLVYQISRFCIIRWFVSK